MLRRLRRRQSDSQQSNSDGSPPYLVVGLGNPGRRYENTRHNVGFMVIDRLYDRLPHTTSRRRFQAHYVETTYNDKRLVLAKPETFMNESGVAVAQLVRWYRVPLDRLLIVYDELDLPLGTIRLRPNGSAGGHNGVASVLSHLKTQEVPRLRVGIDRPRAGSTVPYVLSPFSESQRRMLPAVLDRAADAVLTWVDHGIVVAMNEYNRKAAAQQDPTGTGQ